VASRLARALGNEHYRGHAFGWVVLLLFGAINLFRGSVHLFSSDGGAASIAGIDLSQNGEVILTLFAAMGLTQLLMAGIDFAVALRFRALAPLVVGYHLIQQVGAALILWGWRPLPVDAPGKAGALFILPVAALGFWAAIRRREAKQPAPGPSDGEARHDQRHPSRGHLDARPRARTGLLP
jgi:hypothetical protein